MSCLLHSNASGFWRAKVNRYACLNTHMKTLVYAHLLSGHVCMHVRTTTHKYGINVSAEHVNTRRECLLICRPSVFQHISPSISSPERPARLLHADKHTGVIQPINILKKRCHAGPSSTSWSSWTCPFTAREATVLCGNINFCRSTFSIHSLSSLILFYFTLAVYGAVI